MIIFCKKILFLSLLLSIVSCGENSSQQSSLRPISSIEQIKGLWVTEFLNSEYYYKINEDGSFRQLIIVRDENQYHVTEGRFEIHSENSSYSEVPDYDSCNGSSGLHNTKGIGLSANGELSFYIGNQFSKFQRLDKFPSIDKNQLKEVCFKPAFQDNKLVAFKSAKEKHQTGNQAKEN